MPTELYPDKPLLLIDDEPAWLRTMSLALKSAGRINHLQTCSDSSQVPELLRQGDCSMVLLDLNMPNLDGEQLLAWLRQERPALPVVVISAVNQVETAVRCVKAGAADFFVKTDERQRVVSGIERILEQTLQQRTQQHIIDKLFHDRPVIDEAFSLFQTQSPLMHNLFIYLKAIAQSREPLLISGESGSGKELVARTLWRLQGEELPWVAVNVAGLDDMMFSDTLFGHRPGAFTGAEGERAGMIQQAGDGLLFLDEIGDLSASSQVKLLRLLEEREYYPLGADQPAYFQARVIAATNRDLRADQAAGHFRRDLLHRLNIHHVSIPPLRQRPEDIPLLIDAFVAEIAGQFDQPIPAVSNDFYTCLQHYPFPGNVRELRALVYDAMFRHQQGPLTTALLAPEYKEHSRPAKTRTIGAQTVPAAFPFPEQLPTLKEMSRLLVEEALRRSEDNQRQAARLLGISQQALNQRLRKNN